MMPGSLEVDMKEGAGTQNIWQLEKRQSNHGLENKTRGMKGYGCPSSHWFSEFRYP